MITTQRNFVFRFTFEEISGFSKSYYTLLRTPRRWHTLVCAAVLYRSPFFQRWRPSARLTTERYVNEQIPQLPAERRKLYQIAALTVKRGDSAFGRTRLAAFHLRLAACAIARWNLLQAKKHLRSHI